MPATPPIYGKFPSWTLRLVPQAAFWYFRDHPVRIITNYFEYAAAFREAFSILFLLKTLFSPWKSIKDLYPRKGFNLQLTLETFFLNLTTRGIGALIRLTTIVTGLAIQLVLIAGFALYLAWWIVFPFILALIPFYLVSAFFL